MSKNIRNKKLQGKSRQELIQIYEAIQEKKRRLKTRRQAFTPNEGQMEVIKSDKPFKWVFAGNGSGKTAYAVNQALWWLSGYNPIKDKLTKVPCRVVVVLDKPSKVEETWLPELNKWANIDPKKQYDKQGKPFVSRIIWRNGSELLFKFHEQGSMTFESIEADYVILDEPPPRNIYISLIRGMRKKGSQPELLEVGTPIAARWLREEIYEPWVRGEMPDTECFKFSSDVNKENVNWEFLQKSVFTKYSEQEERMRRHGEFFDLEGLALAHLFDRRVHLVEPFEWNPRWPCVVAVDPAQAKPHVACLLGAHPNGNLYYLKEISSKCSPREFARQLRDMYHGFNVVDVVCDSLGSSDGTGGDGMKSFIDVLNDEGVRARPTTYDEKNDEAWLSSIQDVLLIRKNSEGEIIGPKLYIFYGNDMITREIENVSWKKDKTNDVYKPKLEISKLDALACLKYALAANLVFDSGQQPIYSPKVISWKDRLDV